MGKTCELCGKSAAIHCSADDAELCWSCDAEVHGANDLAARHLRSVLCAFCVKDSKCQTPGTPPCPLSCRCSALDSDHASKEEQANLTWSLGEGNDDSEDVWSSAVPWLPMGVAVRNSCGRQGSLSLSDALSSVEDEKTERRPLAVSSRGRRKRMGGGGAAAAATKSSSSFCQRRKHVAIKKSRKKRCLSPVSVIPVDNFFSNDS